MTEDKVGRLVTFKVSHYCEKTRWALDYVGIPYVEECHIPVIHRFTYIKNGFFSITAPLYVPYQKGYPRTLKNSPLILQYCNDNSKNGKKLLPSDPKLVKEINALEKIFDDDLGPTTRRWVYYYFIDNKAAILKLLSGGVEPGIETSILDRGYYVIKSMMRMRLGVSKKGRDEAEKKIDSIFQMVEDRLSDGRRYLVGDSLSTADITFASLASPVLGPEEIPFYFENKDIFPKEAEDIIMKYRESVAGQFALRLYKEHRYEK
ncbi:unnamed protein product [Cunninghamella echinulata]